MKRNYFLLKSIANITSGEYHKLIRATFNPLEEQENVLLNILQKNKDTNFGKKFNFSLINSVKDYQKRVPITDYDFLYPWIEKQMQGEPMQLTKSKVQSFGTTSGTTSNSKFIPITKDYIESYKKSLSAWIISAFSKHPEIAGKSLSIVSSRIEGYLDSGMPYGAISGLMDKKKGPISNRYSVIKDDRIFSIKDVHTKYYTLARISLSENLTYIHTANPLSILNLCKTIEENSEKLVEDIYNGNLSVNHNLKFKKNKKRALELESLLENKIFSPMNFWPNMALIGCWQGGTQHLFLEELKKRFGKAPIRDIGLLSTEGRVTIPLRNNTSSGLLDLTNSFFEFIPENDIESKNPIVLTAEQIKENENYFVLLTTKSGLYRYNIFDLVKVTGFYNNTPELAFLNKGSHISNVTGEKISEYQIVDAYKKSRTQNMADEFILYPKVSNGKVNYIFLSTYEADSDFAKKMDEELMKSNSEYLSRRKGKKISQLEIKTISKREFDEISNKRLNRKKDAQFKHKYIGELNLEK